MTKDHIDGQAVAAALRAANSAKSPSAAATLLAQAGLPVLGVGIDKRPRARRGVLGAVRDPQRAAKLCAGAWGVAVRCGTTARHGGLVSIDLDCHPSGPDGLASWDALAVVAAEGWTVATAEQRTVVSHTPSGGRHLHFVAPPGLVLPPSVSRLAAGVDVRAQASYVIVWGPGYRHQPARAVASIPAWLAGTILAATPARPRTSSTRRHRYMEAVVHGEAAQLAQVPAGGRHRAALAAGVRIGDRAKAVGLNSAQVAAAIRPVVETATDLAPDHARTMRDGVTWAHQHGYGRWTATHKPPAPPLGSTPTGALSAVLAARGRSADIPARRIQSLMAVATTLGEMAAQRADTGTNDNHHLVLTAAVPEVATAAGIDRRTLRNMRTRGDLDQLGVTIEAGDGRTTSRWTIAAPTETELSPLINARPPSGASSEGGNFVPVSPPGGWAHDGYAHGAGNKTLGLVLTELALRPITVLELTKITGLSRSAITRAITRYQTAGGPVDQDEQGRWLIPTTTTEAEHLDALERLATSRETIGRTVTRAGQWALEVAARRTARVEHVATRDHWDTPNPASPEPLPLDLDPPQAA